MYKKNIMESKGWLNSKVSLYSSNRDLVGESSSINDILFVHYKRNLEIIEKLRQIDINLPRDEYKALQRPLKDRLMAFTPAGLLESRRKGNVKEISRSGLLQLDFDYYDIREYEVENLKKWFFELPWVGYSGLSCSGHGFYCLILIAEPNKLTDYANHIFDILKKRGITADESKGRLVTDLRYLSWDEFGLIKERPEILKIPAYIQPKQKKAFSKRNLRYVPINSKEIQTRLKQIGNTEMNERWLTIRRISYFLGHSQNPDVLEQIILAIEANPICFDEEDKLVKCAEDAFQAGWENTRVRVEGLFR